MDKEEWFFYKLFCKERYKTCQGEKSKKKKSKQVVNLEDVNGVIKYLSLFALLMFLLGIMVGKLL